MSSIKQLFQLQEVDLEIDRRQERLVVIEPQLGDETPLVEPRSKVAQQSSRLVEIRREEREAEFQYADMKEKTQSLEGRLYSGKVRNPRELEGMQQEVDYLRNHQRQAEDRLLEQSLAVEECQGALASAEERLGHMEEEWEAQQEELRRERETLQQELAALQARRGAMVVDIPASDLTLYQQLRKTRGGWAVSRVERGLCQGCRIALSIHQFQRARTSQEPVLCSSCGRILYLS